MKHRPKKLANWEDVAARWAEKTGRLKKEMTDMRRAHRTERRELEKEKRELESALYKIQGRADALDRKLAQIKFEDRRFGELNAEVRWLRSRLGMTTVT